MTGRAMFLLVVLTPAAALAAPASHSYLDSQGRQVKLQPALERIAVVPAAGVVPARDLAVHPDLAIDGRARRGTELLEIPLRPEAWGQGERVAAELLAAGLISRVGAVYEGFWLDRGVILKLRAPADERLSALLQACGLELRFPLGDDGTTFACQARDALAALAAARSAAERAEVAWALPDFTLPIRLHYTPNDTYFADQWHHYQASGAHIRSKEAWDVTLGDPQVVVAVIDTGLEEDHPDFDPAHIVTGYDVPYNDNDPTPTTDAINAHGTCCSGEIAARANNNLGVAGVCPSCSLMGIRLFEEGSGADISEGYLAFQYATTNGAWVMSNSWGLEPGSGVDLTPFYQAVQQAVTDGRSGLGSVVLFASGNGDPWTGQAEPIGSGELANMPEVLAVGGSGYNDVVVSYSDYGPNLSVVAPTGTLDTTGDPQIVTTDTTGTQGFSRNGTFWAPGWFGSDMDMGWPEIDSTGNYTKYFNGTSAACPIAAGVVALVFSASPALTGAQARFIVEQTADKVGGVSYDANGHQDHYGFGRVNAGRATRAAEIGFDNPGGATCAEDFNCESEDCDKPSSTDFYGTCTGAGACDGQPNGTPCDDLNACTSGDQCSGGACVGSTVSCDDSNPCTTDSCSPATGCAHADNTAACNDGSACTTGDACSNGSCSGTSINCDDSNPCTTDSCEPATGCVHSNNSASCDDGSACTSNDHCSNGSCTGSAVSCDDGNPCTTDSCDPANGCAHADNSAACDDGDVCNGTESCNPATGCQAGTALSCDDGNPCTDDSCAAGVGCQHANNSAACDDGDACTGPDTCSAGACAGTALSCDDDNPCTDDACVPASGCQYTQTTRACDDGNRCTISDTCAAGACVGTPADCSRLNGACTVGTCDPADGQCHAEIRPDGTACDDGDPCTAGDSCHGGSCLGAVSSCDDDNPCTTDACDPGTGSCSHQPLAAGTVCSDGDACTTADACDAAGACSGSALDCSALNGACAIGVCDASTGTCRAEARSDGTPCDDGDACTASDTCQAGNCLAGEDTCGGDSGCGCAASGQGSVGSLGLLLLGLMVFGRRRRA